MKHRSKNVSNLELLAKVRAALHSEPRLGPSFHASELRIEPDGVLVLAGEVPSVDDLSFKELEIREAEAGGYRLMGGVPDGRAR